MFCNLKGKKKKTKNDAATAICGFVEPDNNRDVLRVENSADIEINFCEIS